MSPAQSVHRVGRVWRWLSVLFAPLLLALMGWAIAQAIGNYRSEDVDASLWLTVVAVLLFAGLSLLFIASLVWAFRARIVFGGDTMTVRGAFRTTVVTPERMQGFRIVNGQLYVYLDDRRFALQIAYFEAQWVIEGWVRQHTTDIAAEMLAEEDAAIAKDMTLGMSEAGKAERLGALRRLVRRANRLIYAAAVVAVVNALFAEHGIVERMSVAALVLTPLFLDVTALFNRGHMRVDHDEGSRYPQIFTASLASGLVLAMLAVLERGALLDERRFWALAAAAVAAKGLLWCLIDADRLRILLRRGRAVLALTLFALFLIPAFWAGGSLYYVNRHLDTSATVWHDTEIAGKKASSGRVPTYSVSLAPWGSSVGAPIEVTVRRAEYRVLEPGTPVSVGVRQGAIGVRWIADFRAGRASAEP